MNVISAGALYTDLAIWVGVAILLAVGATYLLRPRTRARYPGGNGRYLAALLIQAAGFMIPIPVVMILLIGQPILPGLDVVLAITAGVLVVVALRYAPVTGKLLGDLHRARLEEALNRMGPKS